MRCTARYVRLLPCPLLTSTKELRRRPTTPPTLQHLGDDKENTEHLLSNYSTKLRERHFSVTMQPHDADTEMTPRPNKRRLVQDNLGPPQQFSPRPSQSDTSSELESHYSGRLSPTKQLAFLEDCEDPIIYCDFNSARAKMSDNVQRFQANVQLLADGAGILEYEVSRSQT